MGQEIIKVDNLKCGGCANSVIRAFQAVKDVSTVNVDPESGTVEINYEKAGRREEYIKLLSKLGYPEAGTSTLLQKGKSYISCAVGRIKK